LIHSVSGRSRDVTIGWCSDLGRNGGSSDLGRNGGSSGIGRCGRSRRGVGSNLVGLTFFSTFLSNHIAVQFNIVESTSTAAAI
jgi:hypothetical protein